MRPSGGGSPLTPPPAPPPAPPSGSGGGGGRRWLVVLIAIVVLAVIATPVALFFALADSAEPQAAATPGEPQEPAATLAPAPDATTPPAPSTAPGNPLDDLLGDQNFDDLLGSDVLAQCLAPPGAAPNLQGTPLPDDPAEAIDAIADQVADVRGLEFDTPVELDLLTDAELAERIVVVSEEDYPTDDSDVDDAILTTLGQLDPDQDLRSIYFALLGEQVAGFYDQDTGELVAESESELAPDDMVIVAHELDHALTDQALGLPDFEGMEDDVDALIARQGLVEGDATALMQQWAITNLSLFDLAALGTTAIDTAQLDTAPYVLQAQLLYPYEAGLEFVCNLYVDGGWAAVDAAYTDLPTTSAQVLFPERYLAREAAVPVAPATAGSGWEEIRATTWGAADLMWLIEAPGNDPARGPSDAMERAADWAGGRQTAWQQGDQTMVSLDLVQQPGGDLCTTMRDWIEAAWPDGAVTTTDNTATVWTTSAGAVALTCDGDAVRAVVGPDEAAVTSVTD